MQRSGLAEICHCIVDRQGRGKVDVMTLFTFPAGIHSQAERLIGLRIKRHMHVGEQSPILFRTPPGKGARKGVAIGTSAAHIVGGDVGFVLDAVLGKVHHGLRFLGRQAMVCAQILEDRSRFHRGEAHALLPHHPLDGFFPSFGCGTLPGDAQ
jgi:hypothetical protein